MLQWAGRLSPAAGPVRLGRSGWRHRTRPDDRDEETSRLSGSRRIRRLGGGLGLTPGWMRTEPNHSDPPHHSVEKRIRCVKVKSLHGIRSTSSLPGFDRVSTEVQQNSSCVPAGLVQGSDVPGPGRPGSGFWCFCCSCYRNAVYGRRLARSAPLLKFLSFSREPPPSLKGFILFFLRLCSGLQLWMFLFASRAPHGGKSLKTDHVSSLVPNSGSETTDRKTKWAT